MNLPPNVLMQNPAGTWCFVGRVDVRLLYQGPDGEPPTAEQLDTALHCGPGFAKLRPRTWPTREEAIEAASEIGATVTA